MIEIEEGSAPLCVLSVPGKTRLVGHVRERAIAVVVVEPVPGSRVAFVRMVLNVQSPAEKRIPAIHLPPSVTAARLPVPSSAWQDGRPKVTVIVRTGPERYDAVIVAASHRQTRFSK